MGALTAEPDGPSVLCVAARKVSDEDKARAKRVGDRLRAADSKYDLGAPSGRKRAGHEGVSQLARDAGVAKSFVSTILRGKKPQAVKTVLDFIAVARQLGVRVEWAVTGEPPITLAPLADPQAQAIAARVVNALTEAARRGDFSPEPEKPPSRR